MYQLLSLLLISSSSLEDFYAEPLPFSNSYFQQSQVIYESDPFIRWEILREGYEFKVEISDVSNVKVLSSPFIQGNSLEIHLATGFYYWSLTYRHIGTIAERKILLNPFWYKADDSIESDSEEEKIEETEEEDTKGDTEKNSEDVNEKETNINIKEETEDVEEEKTKEEIEEAQSVADPARQEKVSSTNKEILGVKDEEVEKEETEIFINECSAVYDRRKGTYSIDGCSFDFPEISEATRYEIDEEYDYILIKGSFLQKITVKTDIIDCRKFSLFDPSTWFRCKEETTQKIFTANVLYSPKINIDGKKSTISSYDISDGSFVLKIFSEKLNKENIFLTFNIHFYFHIDNTWIEFRDKVKEKITYTKKEEEKDNPLEYVFENIIGVTQWHGYTAYDSPHTGIDFGAVEEEVLSPEDGIIVSVGWDSYYGKCNSGGNYVKIKHSNGLYTVYFHLKEYINEEGHRWKAGEKIEEGQRIGITGNTGAYNCQPLGYHLHYEVRKSASQSTHTDPVPLTNIDWALIPTINWQTYPGRLTGDNPHPNF